MHTTWLRLEEASNINKTDSIVKQSCDESVQRQTVTKALNMSDIALHQPKPMCSPALNIIIIGY